MFSLSRQDGLPISKCDCCHGEVFADDLVHFVEGFVICPDCFDDFAFDYFAPFLVTGDDLKEMLCSYDYD